MGLFNKIKDFIVGKNKQYVSPDNIQNIRLLNDAKILIEAGVFVRFFKKPFIGFIEIIIYSFSLLLAIGGYWLYHMIDSLINVVIDGANVMEILFNANWNFGIVNLIEFLLFVFVERTIVIP